MTGYEIPRPGARAAGARGASEGGGGPTRVVAGVDEAGLGPLLGPLCIGWAVFRAPVDSTDDLWRLLQDVVSRDPKRDRSRLVVADSKKVFTRNGRGLARLENTVLSFLSQLDAAGRPPLDARSMMLGGPIRPEPDLLDRHPWYTCLEPLPVTGEGGALELKAEKLRRALARTGVELLSLGVRVVPAGELNASFHETSNKSATVWYRLEEILRHLWTAHGEPGLRAVVDRQGGRWHYGPLLGRGFPDASVRLVTEAPGFSEFELVGRPGSPETPGAPGRRMRLAFAERAEDESFAVALASCAAKYARELAMRAFNTYFGALQPGLLPTAGYREDGRRWLREARAALESARVAAALLERTR